MLLLLAFLALGVTADLYTCKDQTIAVGPNGYQIQTPTFAPNQNCTLQFTWPDDQYATLTFAVVGLSGDTDQIVPFSTGADGRSLNQSFWDMLDWPNVTFAWPPSTVSINIKTGATTKLIFNFNIKVESFSVQNAPTTTLRPLLNAQPCLISFQDLKKNTAYSVESQNTMYIKLSYNDWYEQNAMNFFIYEGSGKNMKLIGTIHSMNTFQELSNKNFTIFSAANIDTDGMLLINDNRNNPTAYDFVYSMVIDGGYEEIEAANYNKTFTSGFTIVNKDGVYLNGFNIKGSGFSLNMLAGGPIGPSNATLLTSYGQNNIDQLPQYIPSGAVWSLMSLPQEGFWSAGFSPSYSTISIPAYNKLSGFIISDNYPFLSSSQNSKPFKLKTGNTDPFTVAFTVYTNSPNKDAYISIDTGNTNPVTINLNTISVPYSRAFTTKSVSLVINGGSAPSNGTYITYTVASTFNRPAQ